MPESEVERTPGGLRGHVERIVSEQQRQPRAFPTITDTMQVSARFTLAKWAGLLCCVVAASLAAYGFARDVREEQRSLRSEVLRDREANGQLVNSLNELGRTIGTLNVTVAELRTEVRSMQRQRNGGKDQ